MRLLLIRHGESVGNSENRLQGQEDYDLTERGRRQALVTGERIAAEGITCVYTSPLLRALATARTLAARLGCVPVALPGLSEYHVGEVSGLTYAEVRQRFAADPAMAALPAAERAYPGEEGRENFFRRVSEAIWGIVERHAAEEVAVVSHGGPIALFCQNVLGLPYRRPMPFSIDNCSLTVIEIDAAAAARGRRLPAVLVRLNDTCHLRDQPLSPPHVSSRRRQG